MRYSAAFITSIICLLFSSCHTSMPALSSNDKSTFPGISIIVQCKNAGYVQSDIMNIVGSIGAIGNVIIRENSFTISEINITCFGLREEEINNIEQRIRQITGVISVVIQRV